MPFFGAFLQGLIAWYTACVGVGRLQMALAMCAHAPSRHNAPWARCVRAATPGPELGAEDALGPTLIPTFVSAGP